MLPSLLPQSKDALPPKTQVQMLEDEQILTDLVKPLSPTRERSAHRLHPAKYKSAQDDRERKVYGKRVAHFLR